MAAFRESRGLHATAGLPVSAAPLIAPLLSTSLPLAILSNLIDINFIWLISFLLHNFSTVLETESTH